jgi:hypothetical protein
MGTNVHNRFDSDIEDLDLALALRRLADASEPPPIDPRREAALMAAFDASRHAIPMRRPYWAMAGLAAAAALLIAVTLPARAGRHGSPQDGTAMHKPLPSSSRGVQPDPLPPMEFVLVPGAAGLPPMESGSLVRMEIPVSMLPSLGLTPPAASVAAVRADVIVGQDGLKRAVRLVD